MSAPAATTATDGITAASEPIRAVFYGRKNRTDTIALRLLRQQYSLCERVFRPRVVITHCFYDLPADVDPATLHDAGLPRRAGGWRELAASLSTPEPGYDLIVSEKAERLSRDPFEILDRERLAAQHCVPIAYATEPWNPVLEMLPQARALTALLRRRVLGASYFTIGNLYMSGQGV
ncbi:hypothetical protein HFP15_18695 [Amycolatopsis sp. K13G38]|uniref:Uncharacterized protein n=1 Tax=Amycolatopsis acididurans TaxID=2724524 RepID=A0ABX1J523_9PSEU|nr:hypothetical protein [Amycolatopsis acididurans]NKQ54915.1 hypothetical protein [Amycolatopsis acididurans]